MPGKTILSFLLGVALSSVTSLAKPAGFNRELVGRDVSMNCSNAPTIPAGTMLQQGDTALSPNLPPTGSTDKWKKYIWCTPGTRTYIIWDFGLAVPYPDGYYNVYEGVQIALASAQGELDSHGDGFIGEFKNSGWFPNLPNTGVRIEVHDSIGKITWGILHAALTGMSTMVANYDKSNYPFYFSLNDGDWHEVGQGYMGLLPGNGDVANCFYERTGDTKAQTTLCAPAFRDVHAH